MKKIMTYLQIILFLISPFTALALATKTSAVDTLFLAMFVMITIAEWLAIYHLGNITDD